MFFGGRVDRWAGGYVDRWTGGQADRWMDGRGITLVNKDIDGVFRCGELGFGFMLWPQDGTILSRLLSIPLDPVPGFLVITNLIDRRLLLTTRITHPDCPVQIYFFSQVFDIAHGHRWRWCPKWLRQLPIAIFVD